jgi:hypothetical protein
MNITDVLSCYIQKDSMGRCDINVTSVDIPAGSLIFVI